jgi:transposase
MLYCGLDLHAKESYLYVIDQRGRRIMSRSIPTQARCFKEWLGPLVKRKLKVVVEASTMTNWAVEQLRTVGAEVVVVDPRRVRLIAETRRKNDRADARVLAELARTGALPPPLPMPSEQARVLRARLVVRRGFVAQRGAILCRAGALLRSVGIRISTRGLQRPGQWDKLLRRRDLPQWLVCLLRSLREAVEVVERMIDSVEEQYQSDLKDERVKRLRTIPGVGPIASLTLVASVDRAERFTSSRRIGSYAGLVPREYISAETVRRGHVTKEGRKDLRTVWVEAAHVALRMKKHPLGRWGHRLVYRRGRKVAVVALARRMLCMAFAMLRDGTVFEASRLQPINA